MDQKNRPTTRFYHCTLTVTIPAEGPPTITASAWQPAAGAGPPETGPAAQNLLTEPQRAHLFDLARRKGVLKQLELLIKAATTAAEGRELRDQLRALPDPMPRPAQQQGA